MFGKRNDNNSENEDNKKIKYNSKLTLKRRKELEEEIDALIAKLSDDDVIKLEDMGELTEEEIIYIKRRIKKKKEKSKREKFEQRIRCDEETIARIDKAMRDFIFEHNVMEKEVKNQNRDERIYSGNSTSGGKNKQKNEKNRGAR